MIKASYKKNTESFHAMPPLCTPAGNTAFAEAKKQKAAALLRQPLKAYSLSCRSSTRSASAQNCADPRLLLVFLPLRSRHSVYKTVCKAAVFQQDIVGKHAFLFKAQFFSQSLSLDMVGVNG